VSDVTDIVLQLRRVADNGSRAERRLARLVLDDLDRASRASIADLAAQAQVSEPTVTRFCRSLGCDGIREFKLHLAQAVAIGGIYLYPNPLEHDADKARIVAAICDGAAAAIEHVRRSVDMRVITAVARRIVAAKTVLAFGSGGTSSMAATELQNRLFRLGTTAVAHSDGQMQIMIASLAEDSTVVLAFSTSGYVQSLIEAVGIARGYGATAVAVTAPVSPLARAADLVVPFVTAEDNNVYKPSPSRYALLALVDLIAMAAAETRGPDVLEGLRRLRVNVNIFKVHDPRLPLGD